MTLALVVDILFSDPARVTIRTDNEATLCKLRLHHTPPLPKDLPQEQASLSSVPVSLFGALLFDIDHFINHVQSKLRVLLVATVPD